MNFKTKRSADNRLLFTDKYDRTFETEFVNVTYNNDSYVLAKKDNSPFYTLLDLDGREIDSKLNIIYRFSNGNLLTYNSFEKEYRSSDSFRYNVNYNVYSVYNPDTATSSVISIIQSDVVAQDAAVVPVREFMGKTILAFDNLIFSDIIDDKMVITATHFNLKAETAAKNLEGFYTNKIWNIADLTLAAPFNGETSVEDLLIASRTFKEVEYTLYMMVSYPAPQNNSHMPSVETENRSAESAGVSSIQNVNKTERRRLPWKMVFGGSLSFSFN